MEALSGERQIAQAASRVTALDGGIRRNSRSHGSGSRRSPEAPVSPAKRVQSLYRIVLGCAYAGARGPAPG
jgi:hypothetical protein